MTQMATLVHIFFQASVLLVLMIPILTMRQFAEESKSAAHWSCCSQRRCVSPRSCSPSSARAWRWFW